MPLLVQILVEYLIVVLLEHDVIHGLPEIIQVVILYISLHLVPFQHHWILDFSSFIEGFKLIWQLDVKRLHFDAVALGPFNNRHRLLATQFFHIAWLLFFLRLLHEIAIILLSLLLAAFL